MKISTTRIIIFIIGFIVVSVTAILPFYILSAKVLHEATKRLWLFILLSLTAWLIWPFFTKNSYWKILLIALLLIELLLGLSFYQFIKNYTPTAYPG